MKICIVRHGETDWNAQGRLQGREDIPLNESGRQQSERCAHALGGEKWDAIITSPLKRAAETASIIANILGIPTPIVDENLIERDFGAASGLLPDVRRTLFPDGNYEGMEPWELLRDRVYSAVSQAAERFFPKNIIIVSHGGIINALLAEISNHEVGTGKTRLVNTCLNMLSYEDRVLKLVFHNKACEDFLRIRKATPADAESLMDLYQNHLHTNPSKEPQDIQIWRKKLFCFEANTMYNILVGEIGESVVSAVTLVAIENLTRNMRPYAIIENVVTHADFRGKGYATALMQKATEVAAALGCYKIMLLTGTKQENTLRFYENCGFNKNDKTGFVNWI